MSLFHKQPKVRTRFAPSPTGYLHIGGLRSSLFEYLFAKSNKGVFFLRIEDTDQSREVEGAVDNLLKTLKIVGIEPEEGLFIDSEGKVAEKGHFGPYTQSQRLDLYQKYAQNLVNDGHAYYCFCSPERLAGLREKQEKSKKPTRYDGLCRNLSLEEAKVRIAKGEKYVIRMKMPENRDIEFEDMIKGKIKFNTRELDDQVLLKADGFPTYHLAHIVDDHLMETTHVIRAEEWLPSTPKHIILFECFGWEIPRYAHMPMVLNTDKSKLSKRQGDVAVEDYLAKGYLPEALVNFVALLGWNPGTEQEIFSMAELIKEFSFDKVHKAGAVFDIKKLDWMNGEYIKKMDLDKFIELAKPYLEKNIGDDVNNIAEKELVKAYELEKQRIFKLSEIGESVKFLFTESFDYNPQILVWKKSDKAVTIKNLKSLSDELSAYQEEGWTAKELEEKIINFVKDNNLTNGEVLWPMRVALTGQEKSPTPFEVAEILGKEKSLKRLEIAINLLS